MDLPVVDIERFLQFAETLPVLDARSPGEFEHGHVSGAVSLPLFSDEERALVGTKYRKSGQKAAILLGLELVGPKMAELVKNAFKNAPNQELLLYCWRGGMRSQSLAWLLNFSGLKVLTLKGGYKAYRRKVLQAFEQPRKLIVLGGMTGSGKTEILKELKKLGEQVIDLEHYANHKGSAYGGIGQPAQPTTEQFENNLFTLWQKLDCKERIWLEDESRSIGCINIPYPLWLQMKDAFVVNIIVPKERRIERLVHDYAGMDDSLLIDATMRIRKKLGGERTERAIESIRSKDYAKVARIALNYYDKAYQILLDKKLPDKLSSFEFDNDNPSVIAADLIDNVNRIKGSECDSILCR